MMIKMIVIDVQLTRRQKMAVALAMAAGLTSLAAVASADQTSFAAGETLKAVDLNGNFSELYADVSDLQARAEALEEAPAPLTTVDILVVPNGALHRADCMNGTGTFPQGACARMANAHCGAQGYKTGWFEGDLEPPNFVNPAVVCIK